MVQRLPNPGMIPTCQESGGMVHDNSLALTAVGVPPGYDGGSFVYPVSSDRAPVGPDPALSDVTVPVGTDVVAGPGAAQHGGRYPGRGSTLPARVPAGQREGGQWTSDPQGPAPEGPWVKTRTTGPSTGIA